jgi:copper chaperone CopZ
MLTKHADTHGLNCPNCSLELERMIAGLPGVRDARVAFEAETTTAEYDLDVISIERIVATIRSFRCESECLLTNADVRSYGTGVREPVVEGVPFDSKQGCCQVGVDDVW